MGPYEANVSEQEIKNETTIFPINFTELAYSLNKKMPTKIRKLQNGKNVRNY